MSIDVTDESYQDIRTDETAKALVGPRKQLTISSRAANNLVYVSAFLSYCVRWDYLEENPAQKGIALDEKGFDALEKPRDRTLMYVLAYSGFAAVKS